VRVDAARRHHATCSVDLLVAARERSAELRDPTVDDADIRIEGVARCGDAGIADD